MTTYSDAFNELQQIVQVLEEGEVSVDELTAKVKRAKELIRICRVRLKETEDSVGKVMDELENLT
jgi:exodeoxyribonuclease VII small subunit